MLVYLSISNKGVLHVEGSHFLHINSRRRRVAQTTTGSIVGTITDPSGAAVPGAVITVTNEATGIVAIRLTADSSGNYVATTLPLGRYSVTVEATGFKNR